MGQRENRRVYARTFQNEITRAMHAGGRGQFEGVAFRNAEWPALHLAYLYTGLWSRRKQQLSVCLSVCVQRRDVIMSVTSAAATLAAIANNCSYSY